MLGDPKIQACIATKRLAFSFSMVSPYTLAICASLLCAILMIVGGIWLLAKGVIKLSEAADKSQNGLSVELFNKIKVSTGYPALAFFIIALFFIALAIWFSKPPDAVSIVFLGKLNLDNTSEVRGKIVPIADVGATFQPNSNGVIQPTQPDLRFEVQILAPGYDPEPWHDYFTAAKGKTVKIDLAKDVKFTKKVYSPSPTQGNIIDLPANVNVPPVQEGKGFKPSS
jgi:hypothetical protein